MAGERGREVGRYGKRFKQLSPFYPLIPLHKEIHNQEDKDVPYCFFLATFFSSTLILNINSYCSITEYMFCTQQVLSSILAFPVELGKTLA